MLGLQGKKGSLDVDADADLCVLSISASGMVEVDEVWKFGIRVHTQERQQTVRPRSGRVYHSRL